MKTRFTKMHGAGNDFVVFDATSMPVDLNPARIRHLADRHRGVGCDQVLVVEAAHSPDIDFVYRIFNADGGEVEQCGNGARAFVRFVRQRGLTDKTRIRVATKSGIIEPRLNDDGSVAVDMGRPNFTPSAVAFYANGLATSGAAPAPSFTLDVGGQRVTLSVCSMGNPHAVIEVPDAESAPVLQLGPLLERHARFSERVNVGFSQRIDAQHIRLRVFERGAGETLACGTGACAAVAIGIAQGKLTSPVTVDTHGGQLMISWNGELDHCITLSGPAVSVFDGELDLSLLDEPGRIGEPARHA